MTAKRVRKIDSPKLATTADRLRDAHGFYGLDSPQMRDHIRVTYRNWTATLIASVLDVPVSKIWKIRNNDVA